MLSLHESLLVDVLPNVFSIKLWIVSFIWKQVLAYSLPHWLMQWMGWMLATELEQKASSSHGNLLLVTLSFSVWLWARKLLMESKQKPGCWVGSEGKGACSQARHLGVQFVRPTRWRRIESHKLSSDLHTLAMACTNMPRIKQKGNRQAILPLLPRPLHYRGVARQLRGSACSI